MIATNPPFRADHVGNLITEDDEIAKLRLVVEVAEEVWGYTSGH